MTCHHIGLEVRESHFIFLHDSVNKPLSNLVGWSQYFFFSCWYYFKCQKNHKRFL